MPGAFYAIAATAAEVQALSATNLLTEPHPTHFREFFEAIVAADGGGVALGFPNSEWEYRDNILSAAAWAELQAFFSGDEATADIFIHTRTNQISGDAYEYLDFSAVMHRPEGTSTPSYRFRDVLVRFTHLIPV